MKRARITAEEVASLKARVPMSSLISDSGITLQRDTRTEFIALCPFHSEDTPSFRVYADHAHCFGCGWHGDTLEWLMQQERMSFAGAVRHLREWSGTVQPQTAEIEIAPRIENYGWTPIIPVPADAPPLLETSGRVRWLFNPKRAGEPGQWKSWRPSLVHPYRLAGGELAGLVLRVEKQDGGKFTPAIAYCEKDGERQWCILPLPAPRPLYRLEHLHQRPNAPVAVVEGEKTADAAARLLPSFVVVSWAGGSKAYHLTDWTPLRSRRVIGIPDADAEGRAAFDGRTTARGRRLPGILDMLDASSRRVEPPASLPQGWDLADAEKEGWDTARTVAWLKQNIMEPRNASA